VNVKTNFVTLKEEDFSIAKTEDKAENKKETDV